MDYSPTGSSVHGDSPGKNIGAGFHAPLQGELPDPGMELASPVTLYCRWILYCSATGEAGQGETCHPRNPQRD